MPNVTQPEQQLHFGHAKVGLLPWRRRRQRKCTISDLLTLQNNFQTEWKTFVNGDFNGDGMVTIRRLPRPFTNNFTRSVSPPPLAKTSRPHSTSITALDAVVLVVHRQPSRPRETFHRRPTRMENRVRRRRKRAHIQGNASFHLYPDARTCLIGCGTMRRQPPVHSNTARDKP